MCVRADRITIYARMTKDPSDTGRAEAVGSSNSREGTVRDDGGPDSV